MNTASDIDYGPLKHIIGIWKGDKGVDSAPEPQGKTTNPYSETITYSAIGNVSNAKSQTLAAVHYHQIVRHKSTDKVFHDQSGYWMWDKKAAIIMHTLTIPRAVCVLAGGTYNHEKKPDQAIMLTVSAAINNKDWQIIQSPFMKDNACTTEFKQQIIIDNNKLSYFQTSLVVIYDKTFEHTDQNELIRQSDH